MMLALLHEGDTMKSRSSVLTASLVLALGLAAATIGLRGQQRPPNREWTSYGADLSNTHYSPLDQITKDNFNKLAGRVALQDRHARPAARLQLGVHAARGQRHDLRHRRHAARRRRARRRDRRDALDVQHQRRQARRRRAAKAVGPRARVLDRRPRRQAGHLRHARLPARRAQREDRRSGHALRQERHRRSEDRTTTR